MFCDCNEPAFTFTKFVPENGMLAKYKIARCNKSIEYSKKPKCSYRFCEKIAETILSDVSIESKQVTKKYTIKEDPIKMLQSSIIEIKLCQDNELPFNRHVNKILYLSKKLRIPPYLPEKHTIEDYYDIANHYLKTPLPEFKHKPFRSVKLITGFDEILTINKTSSIKTNQQRDVHTKYPVKLSSNKFITGGHANDDEENEDEIDVDNFDSDNELNDDGYESGSFSD
jgi:hypothetical protein